MAAPAPTATAPRAATVPAGTVVRADIAHDLVATHRRVRGGDQREEAPVVSVPTAGQPGHSQQRARAGRVLPLLVVQGKRVLMHDRR
jgi:hypothetical protein